MYNLEMGHGHYFRPSPPVVEAFSKSDSLPSCSSLQPMRPSHSRFKTQISIPPKYSSSKNGYIGPIATSRLSSKTGDSLAQAQYPLELSRPRVMEQRCLSSTGMAQRNKRCRHVLGSGLRPQPFGYLQTKRT